MKRKQPEHAQISNQSRYIRLGDGEVGIDRVFKMEDGMEKIEEFLSEKLGGKKIVIPKRNISPDRKINCSDEILARLNKKFSQDVDLYQSL